MSPVETMPLPRGLSARIYRDGDCAMPFDGDEAVRIVVLHRRYVDPAKGACGRTADEVLTWAEDNAADWYVVPLWLYDHSGTVYAAAWSYPFHCPWDSGRAGIIALKRCEWGAGCDPDEALKACAQQIAEDYTAWANGQCFGYVITDSAGSKLDSCWGFVGFGTAVVQATAAAEALATG
jgi:hypothetical protein